MKKLISALVCATMLASSLTATVSSFGVQEKCPAVDDGELLRYWMIWNSIYCEDRSNIRRPDGTNASFDFYTPIIRGTNLVNTYFIPRDENDNMIYAVPNTPDLIKHCEKMQYEIGKLHEAGIKVIGYSDCVQVIPREAERMGIDLADIAATDGKEMVTNSQWFNEPATIACVNSPTWRKWVGANIKVLAEAGFDGLQYDSAPMLITGYFCQCKYCAESWAHYKEDTLGADKKLPQGYLDFSDELDREFMRWKAQSIIDFTRETLAGAREVSPDFLFMQNNNVEVYTYPMEALADGCWDMATSEYFTTDCGYASTMFMYLMNESLGYHELLGMFNNASMCRPLWRYQVAIAESFAVTGGISFFDLDEANVFLDFLDVHPELFLDTKSSNTTALLYSAESNVFSLGTFAEDVQYGIFDETDDVTRAFSSLMTKKQIPHDYVCLEKEGVLDTLDRYDVYVIPNYTYFEPGTWDAVIEKILASGKSVIVGGDDAKEYVSSFGGSDAPQVKYYKGKTLKEGFVKLFEGTGAAERLTLLSNQKNTELNVRHTDEDHEMIHVIRLGGEENFERHDQELEYAVPAGKTVRDVKVYGPYSGNTDIPATWEMRGDRVYVDTADFDIYAIVALEYEDAPEPSYVPGDANADGSVTVKDAALLSKYLASWQVEPDLAASDVTADGTVNAKDLSLILKYLAGWNVAFAN